MVPELSTTPQTGNAGRLQIQTDTGFTFYAELLQLTGQVWNTVTNAFEAVNSANWAHYVLTLLEVIPTTGCYFGQPPPGAPAGTYLLPIYQQVGSSPASTDPIYLPAGEFSRPLVFTVELNANSAIISIGTFAPAGGPAGAGGQRALNLPARQDSIAVAQDILNKLYSARLTLATQPYAMVNVDGQAVTFTSPDKLDDQIQFWERKVAVLSGKRRRAVALRLDRF